MMMMLMVIVVMIVVMILTISTIPRPGLDELDFVTTVGHSMKL